MVLDYHQRRRLEQHLSPRTGDEIDPPTCTLTLSKRQIAFVLQAIEYFHATSCPMQGKGQACEALSWYESPSTGAMELYCPKSCLDWVRHLAEDVVPAAFPLPGERHLPPD